MRNILAVKIDFRDRHHRQTKQEAVNAIFPSFPDDANLRTIFALAPYRYHHWHEFSEKLMRGDSPFTMAERGRLKTKKGYLDRSPPNAMGTAEPTPNA